MKLHIYFKNVGQGDSILLDWEEVGKVGRRYGMIDCNLVNEGIDPIIAHIEREQITVFDFVIMSHPHSDHFSGFHKFLTYCAVKGIEILRFYHTAALDPNIVLAVLERPGRKLKNDSFTDILTGSVYRPEHKEDLKTLYKRLTYLHSDRRLITDGVHVINDEHVLQLGKDLSLRFLAPYFHDEVTSYIDAMCKITGDTFTPKTLNNPRANLLSSVLQLYSDTQGWQVLLPSDCTKKTLKRILGRQKQLELITKKRLLAAQVPHHGSDKNHLKDFWDGIQQESAMKAAPVVISVGDLYNHPGYTVVEYFDKHYNSVHATNQVGGYEQFYFRHQTDPKERQARSLFGLPGVGSERSRMNFDNIGIQRKCGEKIVEISVEEGEVSCRVIDA